MSTDKYFKELSACLNKLSVEDREEAMNFYIEYAQEAQLPNYETLVQRFGAPKTLSSKIYAESAVKTLEGDNKKIGKAFGIGIIALFSLPLSISFCITVIAILFACAVSAISILFSMGVTVFILLKTAILLFIKSFTYLIPFIPALWLKTFGGSLILISITVAILCILVFAGKWILKLATILMSKIVKRRTDYD